MARKPLTYWEKRSTAMMQQYEKYTAKTIDRLIQIYNQTNKNIEKEIRTIYRNYAKDGVFSKEALNKMLNQHETEAYYKNLLSTINQIENSDIKRRLLVKYNAPAYSFRISRLEALKETVNTELKRLASIEEKVTKSTYKNIIEDGYYRTIYEIQKGLGIGFSFADIDTKTINLMLTEKWYKKANYSARVWNNRDKLSEYISTNILSENLAGKTIEKTARELSDALNVGMHQATRLVRTESNHFANESEMLSYEECEIEKYRFIATLDKVTCEHCGKLDNQVFDIKDRKTGKNYPPIHPNDRCTTVAEFDDGTIDDLERRARDPVTGKTYVIDKNMSYKEWKEQNTTKEGIKEHKIVNGKNIIGKFELTEEEKYSDGGINRIMDIQGYKGNPKIVSNEEFEKASKESNYFSQRTYGGKTKEEVLEYQKQLYSGEWYIECTVGGAQYGNGMYCAATYDLSNSTAISGISEEMQHYIDLAKMRRNHYSIVEDITLDKSAKIIEYDQIIPQYMKNMAQIDNWTKEESLLYNNYHDIIQRKITAYQNYISTMTTRGNKTGMEYLKEYRKYESESNVLKSQFTARMKNSYEKIRNKNESTLAVEMGYDAINAKGHGKSGSYTVILNRTKAIIRKGGHLYEY